ncbi:MAG TPA: aminomethyl-transferring glycine dehydrogenase subunit GcvPB [Thermoleophilia bacterium]|nr:aminomethyl-transferring glycine dehydrogenase subunit GcvPB [Thermoleophilia bacterium]
MTDDCRGSRLEPLTFDRSRPGHRGATVPTAGVPAAPIAHLLAGASLRTRPPALPELSEPEIVRHYTRLSHLNHSVDLGMYPLGSCTMKYNPKINDEVAQARGFTDLHPYQTEDDAQGTLELMWELEQALLVVTGMCRATLQPAAGAHGELVGILMIRAFHRDNGGASRDTVIVPDSAHGTNLATATMAGYKVVELKSSDRGLIDLDTLRSNLSEKTAALMLTNPNTLGLFEEDILEITRLTHEAGALVYYDGANLNAIMGKARPGDMGMDVVHMNLHKTFSTPHGGGGPGAGPLAVCARLEPYLPAPLVSRRDPNEAPMRRADCREGCASGPDDDGACCPRFGLDYDRPASIGRVRGFYGNVGVLERAYAYILSMGGDGLTQASEDAVMNANYLRTRLSGTYDIPHDRLCMHEFVASASRQKRDTGVAARDVAKRILDHGVHAPTIYFPLIVPEALMIEPTETESLAGLDAFVDILVAIDREAHESPEVVTGAPHTTPIRRPDETRAARDPMLRWRSDTG